MERQQYLLERILVGWFLVLVFSVRFSNSAGSCDGTSVGKTNCQGGINLKSQQLQPKAEPGRPDPCRSRVDAVSIIREEYHIFSGKWFWRINRGSGIFDGDPMKINQMWYGLPPDLDRVDSVCERRRNGKIIFFIGSLYWELDDNRQPGKFPKNGRPLTDLGLPSHVTRVDAAFVWPPDERTYVIVGDRLWRLNATGNGVDGSGQQMTVGPEALPVDAALEDFDGNVHLVKGDYFLKTTNLTNWTTLEPRLRNETYIFGCVRPPMLAESRMNSSTRPWHWPFPLCHVIVLALFSLLSWSSTTRM